VSFLSLLFFFYRLVRTKKTLARVVVIFGDRRGELRVPPAVRRVCGGVEARSVPFLLPCLSSPPPPPETTAPTYCRLYKIFPPCLLETLRANCLPRPVHVAPFSFPPLSGTHCRRNKDDKTLPLSRDVFFVRKQNVAAFHFPFLSLFYLSRAQQGTHGLKTL